MLELHGGWPLVSPRFDWQSGFGHTFPEVVRANIAGYLIHPRAELTFFAEASPVFQHPDKNFLRQIFTGRRIGRHPVKKGEQPVMMPFKKHPKMVHFAI